MSNKKNPTKKKEHSLDDYNAINVLKTIEAAKEYLRLNFEDGCKCPCCDQYVKLYKRKIYKSPAKALFGLYKLGRGFHHFTKIGNSAGFSYTGEIGISKLKYWNLIEEEVNINTKKKNSGNWKITKKGCDFIEGKISIPKYVLIYNTKIQGFDGDMIYISDILENFNYQELMNNL